MLYAQVVVNHKTAQTEVFTYAVNPAELPAVKLGVLVEVPFRNRATKGIVVGLERLKPRYLNPAKLKPIARTVSTIPIITGRQLTLARWMASYYGASLGEALFAIVPRFAKTQLP